MPSDGSFLHANIYKLYLLHSHTRNSLITYIYNIIIINYYNHYDLQKIISFIIIFYLYSATSIIGCGASQYAANKNTIRRKLPTDNILK